MTLENTLKCHSTLANSYGNTFDSSTTFLSIGLMAILNSFFFLNKGTSSNSWQSQLISVNVNEKTATTTYNNNMEQTIKAKDEANR